MNQKETWIDNQMNTENYISSVQPSEALLNRLKEIPGSIRTSIDLIPKKYIWAAAACIAILVCLNIWSVDQYRTSKDSSTTAQTEDPYFNYLKQL